MPFVGGMFGFGGTSTPEHVVTSGALAAQAALIDGAANRYALHNGIGALAAQYATMSGAALHPHIASGALMSNAAQLAGVGSVFLDEYWPDVLFLANGSSTITTDSSTYNRSMSTQGLPILDSSVLLFGFPTYRIRNTSFDSVRVSNDGQISDLLTNAECCFELFANPTTYATVNDICEIAQARFEWDKTTLDFSGQLIIGGVGYVATQTSGTNSAGTFKHVALVRDNSDPTYSYVKLYVDGNLEGTSAAFAKSAMFSSADYTGRCFGMNNSSAVSGWFTQMRITRNTARYYGNFTPPTGPFPTH